MQKIAGWEGGGRGGGGGCEVACLIDWLGFISQQ